MTKSSAHSIFQRQPILNVLELASMTMMNNNGLSSLMNLNLNIKLYTEFTIKP